MSDLTRVIGQTLVTTEAIKGTSLARDTAHEARMRANQAARQASRANARSNELVGEVKDLNERVAELEQGLAQRDALILEWMHSNEAFKRLARQYGKKIGVTDEQRQQDFDQQVLDVAEEDPKFAETKKTQGAKARLGNQ